MHPSPTVWAKATVLKPRTKARVVVNLKFIVFWFGLDYSDCSSLDMAAVRLANSLNTSSSKSFGNSG